MGAYNNPVVLPPPQRSPWEQVLPNLMTNLALMKIQQNFQLKQADLEAQAAGKATEQKQLFEMQKLEREHELDAQESRKQSGRDFHKAVMTKAMEMAGKTQEPYQIATSDGVAIGIFNKSAGTLDRSGFEKVGVLPKNIDLSKHTDEDGNVTWVAKNKKTGEDIWSDTKEGIGRAGKTGTTIDVGKIQTDVEKARQLPGNLKKKALETLGKTLPLRETMALENKGYIVKDEGTPNEVRITKEQLLVEEMGVVANIRAKYPDAMYGQAPDGTWAWVVYRNGKYHPVLTEYGMQPLPLAQ